MENLSKMLAIPGCLIVVLSFLNAACSKGVAKDSSIRIRSDSSVAKKTETKPAVTDPVKDKASVSGHIRAADGEPISNARVAISGVSLPEPIFRYTDSSGRFVFTEVRTGTWYVVTVRANSHSFKNPSQVITVMSDVSDLVFVSRAEE